MLSVPRSDFKSNLSAKDEFGCMVASRTAKICSNIFYCLKHFLSKAVTMDFVMTDSNVEYNIIIDVIYFGESLFRSVII